MILEVLVFVEGGQLEKNSQSDNPQAITNICNPHEMTSAVIQPRSQKGGRQAPLFLFRGVFYLSRRVLIDDQFVKF